MFTEWNKFKGWDVLEYFLRNPNTKMHIKGLARLLNVSSRTALIYCNGYFKDNILKREKNANSINFYLNNANSLVKQLKKTWFLRHLQKNKVIENFLKKNKGIMEIILYGGYSSGEYSNHSDIDILIITNSEKIDSTSFIDITQSMGKELGLTKLTSSKWNDLQKKQDSFALSIIKNNISLLEESI